MIASVFMTVFAIVSLLGSTPSQTIENTKGRSFSIVLSDVIDGEEVLPGSEQALAPVITNTSATESVYVFIKFVKFN